MTPVTKQEQEALSKRYHTCAIVVPLSDGTFAVFSNDRTSESMLLVENPDDLAIAIASRAGMHDRKTPSKGRPVELNLAELFR